MKAIALSVIAGLASLPGAARNSEQTWVETFQESPASYTISVPKDLPKEYEYLTLTGPVTGTLRYRFGISIGGSSIRVRLSNELRDTPLEIDGASIAIASGEMDAITGSMRRLTFGGKDGIAIPAGAPVLSDPVSLQVAALSDLVASVYVRNPVALLPLGGASMLLSDGDEVLSEKLPLSRKVVSRPLVTAVLVQPRRPTRVIVALGDSITDGARDTPTVAHGWVAAVARRLAASPGNVLSIVSAGIGGNRVLRSGMGPPALARADRDVFATPGLSYIVLLEGINDIGFSGATAFGVEPALDLSVLIGGYEQIATRAHARGVKIFAGTLTPFQGAFYFSEEKEKLRKAVNEWIRASRVFDGVIDFDRTLRDLAEPDRIKAEFDSGDHLHPGAAGYQAMANSIDLKIFK